MTDHKTSQCTPPVQPDYDDMHAKASEPRTWVRLADWAELHGALAMADDLLELAERKRDSYKAALLRISELCPVTDLARGYIGQIARDAITPPLASAANPGLEGNK